MGLSGFGFGEMLVIAMLVLIVFGPKRLPEITRTLGKGIREFKKGMNEIQRELEAAGRETTMQSPPPPPPSATIAGTAPAGAMAAATAVPYTPGASGADEDAETSGSADPEAAAETGESAGDSEPTEEAPPQPVLEEQAPPVSRNEPDPAQEFIDPWSTDSSKPTFSKAPAPAEPASPAPEPVSAAPEPSDVSAETPPESEPAKAPVADDPAVQPD